MNLTAATFSPDEATNSDINSGTNSAKTASFSKNRERTYLMMPNLQSENSSKYWATPTVFPYRYIPINPV